jgi:plastocyanin
MMIAMSRSWPLFLLAPTAALALSACSASPGLPVGSGSPSGSAASPSAVVLLRYDSFEPSRVTIHAGQTVRWVWQQTFAADIAFKGFASATMANGSWSHTFSVPGTYHYSDPLRQEATGVVVVLP